MKRTLFIVLALMVCASMALAQDAPPAGGPAGGHAGPGGPGGPGGGGYNRGMQGMMGGSPASAITPPSAQFVTRGATALSLDQKQTEDLTALLTKSDADLAALRQKVADTSIALRTAILGAEYDAAKVDLALKAAKAAEDALIKAELKTWVDVRALLKPDQISKLQSTMGQRGGMGGGGNRSGRTRGNNGGGGGNNPPPGGPPPGPAPAPAM